MDWGPGFIRGKAHVLGVSVATRNFKTYIPFNHYTGNVQDKSNYIRWLNHCFSGSGIKLAANIHYDLDALKTLDIDVKGVLYDVQVVDALIDDTHTSYSLESIARRRLSKGKSNESLLVALSDHSGTMSDLDMLHPGQVSEYACDDAALLIEIYESQDRDIAEFDLRKALNRECKLTEVLWRMHRQGVRIDVDKAEQISADLTKRATDWLDEANRLSGNRISPTKTKSIAYVLRERGFHVPSTDKGNDSISNDYLKTINDPVIQAIYQWRRLNKIRKDFIDGLFLKYNVNGRIHPSWFQSRNSKEGFDAASGAATGRITGSKPNLTQIPARDKELGPMCRQLVIAEKGEEYCKLDYSSQEPRIALHYAYLSGISGAAEARNRFIEDPKIDFHQMVADMISAAVGYNFERTPAKTISLGVLYAMGLPKLADSLRLSLEEAKNLLQAYNKGAPYFSEISQKAIARVHDVGFVRTWGGRRRIFNQWESATWGDPGIYNSREEALQHYSNVVRAKAHKALNSIVQGSAADQLKESIILCDSEGYLPLICVYDELGFSVANKEDGNKIARIMETALDFSVPMNVEPSFGQNWGATK